MIILRIRARNIDDVMNAGYNGLKIYSDAAQGGTFSNLITTLPLVKDQEYYEFIDANGTGSTWYEVSYSGPAVPDSPKSTPINGTPVNGPLGLLTIGYVWDTTDIPDISNLPGSKVAELIQRAEALLQSWANRYGGFDINRTNWSTLMPIAARRLLEELFLNDDPRTRARIARGLTSERIGTYQYTASSPNSGKRISLWEHITQEIIDIAAMFLLDMRYKTLMSTTQVFPQLQPYQTPLTPNVDPTEVIRMWNDFLDIDYMPVFPATPFGRIVDPTWRGWDN